MLATQRSAPSESRPSFAFDWSFGFVVPAVLGGIGTAALIWRYWWLADDSFISFRYAANWAAGYGIRYNLGDQLPVEGYSNFLWVAIAAAVERLGGLPEYWMPLTSAVCAVVLLCWVFRTLVWELDVETRPAMVATMALGLFPPFAVWATSGLESMPAALMLFVAAERLLLRREGPAPMAAGIAGLILVLLRFDGLVWGLLIAGLAWFVRANRRGRVLLYLLIVLTGFAIYFVWRFGYYQAWVPNTVLAKISLSSMTLGRGLDYIMVFVLTFLTPLLTLPAAFSAVRRGSSRMIGVAALALAPYAYAVAVGGDFMAMGRFLVPSFPFAALLLGVTLSNVSARAPRDRLRMWWIAGLIVVVNGLPAWNIHVVPYSIRQAFHFRLNAEKGYFHSEQEQWTAMVSRSTQWKKLGLFMKGFAPPDARWVRGAIGNCGYYSELYILDRAGLINRRVASQEFSGPLRSPGHDKMVESNFFLDQNPDYLDVKYFASPFEVEKLRPLLDRVREVESVGPRIVWVRSDRDRLAVCDAQEVDRQATVGLVLLVEPGTRDEVRRMWAVTEAKLQSYENRWRIEDDPQDRNLGAPRRGRQRPGG